MSAPTERLRRAIAIWHGVGGIGIVAIAIIFWSGFQLPGAGVLGPLLYGGFAIASGVWLWSGDRRGIVAGILVQVMQIAYVSLPTLVAGATLGPLLGVRLTSAEVEFKVGVYFRAGLAWPPAGSGIAFPFDVTVNILSLIAIAELLRQYRSTAMTASPAILADADTTH